MSETIDPYQIGKDISHLVSAGCELHKSGKIIDGSEFVNVCCEEIRSMKSEATV